MSPGHAEIGSDAKGQLTDLVRRAEIGNEIIWTRYGHAVVRLVPVKPVPDPIVRRVDRVYQKWGKGHHPAALNFWVCFAYDLAGQHGCLLVYVGADYSQTDLIAAI